MRLKVVVIVSVICSNFCISLAAPSHSKNPELLTNSIGIVLRLIPKGSLRVGEGKTAEEITVPKPFYLGVTEVTNAQAMALMGFIPSEQRAAQQPVDSVTWEEANRFCENLSAVQKKNRRNGSIAFQPKRNGNSLAEQEQKRNTFLATIL